jgi:hypothetical protein
MTDKAVEVRAIAIPGMKIKYSAPLSTDGDGIEFEMAVDSTIHRDDLDELLDKVAGAHRRQAATRELPLLRQLLHKDRKLLPIARRKAADHDAAMTARAVALGANRRREVQPNLQDVNGLQQLNKDVLAIEEAIKLAEVRIPYLEAIIAGKEPPDPFAAANDTALAAE